MLYSKLLMTESEQRVRPKRTYRTLRFDAREKETDEDKEDMSSHTYNDCNS